MPIRASLLLPQDFSLYLKWQKKHCPGANIGQVANALEHHQFVKHRDAQINAESPLPISDGPNTASGCGHKFHPSDMIKNELCPVCEVKAHLSFLHAITTAWNKVGGPRLRPGTQLQSNSYYALRNGWRTARCQLQELLDMFVVLVAYEEAWEAKHPSHEVAAARSTNCASAATRLAHEELRYPARLSSRTLPKLEGRGHATGKKQVTFSPEVQIKSGDDQHVSTSATLFARDRSLDSFKRYSPSYKPGEHASSSDCELVDTSQCNSLVANINNLKIYITDDEDAFDSLQTDPKFFGDFVGHHEGTVGLHELKGDVFGVIYDIMAQGLQQRRDLEVLVEEADRIAVLIDEEMGGVLDATLFDGSDGAEDNVGRRPPDEREGTGSGDWTCLRECLQRSQGTSTTVLAAL